MLFRKFTDTHLNKPLKLSNIVILAKLIKLGQAKIIYVNQAMQIINDEKIQKNPNIKQIYKSISKTNLQIMKDTNENIWNQCELIKANLKHFESESD